MCDIIWPGPIAWKQKVRGIERTEMSYKCGQNKSNLQSTIGCWDED